MSKKPPKFGNWIARKSASYGLSHYLSGDLEEEYNLVIEESGEFNALLWYWRQVLMSIIPFLLRSTLWSFIMFKSYLKIAFRNMQRQKAYTAINMFGLAIGYAIFILATLYSDLSLNGDAHHENSDRMYVVVQVFDDGNNGENSTANIPAPVTATLIEEFPDIEESVSFFRSGRKIFKRGDESFYEGEVLYVEQNFLTFFTHNMISGDKNSVLTKPNSVVISEKKAQKYFGDEKAVGKTLRVDKDVTLTVTGVVEDNTDFTGLRFDFLISMETAKQQYPEMMNDWKRETWTTFVRLPENYRPSDIETKFPAFIEKSFDESKQSPKRMYLFPMLSLTFDGTDIDSPWASAPKLPYLIFIFMGVIILAVVSINFMNLSTARYTVRAKEVGLRKVLGAQRSQLGKQFLGESIILAMLALPIGIGLFEIIRPMFIAFYDNMFTFTLWEHTDFIVRLFFLSIVTGLLSGSYPALFLSGFRPTQILKENLHAGGKSGRFRKILVVSQFVLSITLIVLTIVINRQFDHLVNLDFGFNRENIIYVRVSSLEDAEVDVMRTTLENYSGVKYVSMAEYVPGIWRSEQNIIPEGKSESEAVRLDVYPVGYDYARLYDLRLSKGRFFDRELGDENNFVITDKTAKNLAWEDPLGKQFMINGTTGRIVGIVEEFNFRGPYNKQRDTALQLKPEKLAFLFVKASSPENLNSVADFMKKEWKKDHSDIPFSYDIHDNAFQRWHQDTRKGSIICGAIGLVAIFLSSIGLFGLASFTIQRKTKEIGVRKVLGASVPGIMKLIGREFLYLILTANIIALPIAYFGAKSFVQGMYFDYSIDVGLSVYIIAAALTVGSSIIAVTTQTIKAARANPVDSLRSE